MCVCLGMHTPALPPPQEKHCSSCSKTPFLHFFHTPYLIGRRPVGISTPILQLKKLRLREVGYDLALVTQSGSDDVKMQTQGLSTASPFLGPHQKPKQPGRLCCHRPCVNPSSDRLYLLCVFSARHPQALGKYLCDPNCGRSFRIITLRFHIRFLGLLVCFPENQTSPDHQL